MQGIEKRCFIEDLRSRYGRSKKEAKGRILDMLEECLGVGRRQAKRLMESQGVGRPRNRKRAGRRGKYQDREFKQALRRVWREMRYMCSRHMKAAMPEWLPAIEAVQGHEFSQSVRERLLLVSTSTIDRILREYKGEHGRSLTRAGGFRDEIPIQENVWNIEIPGFLEADTVAHCGGTILGEYIHSLVMVDIATIWTDARATFGKGSTPIVHAIEDIEAFLPFEIRGYDADNGTEVLNQHVLRYFRDERIERGKQPVQVTRSRAYKKNDNAHVEQRNDSVARRWLGYERLDFKELQPLVDHYYKYILCPMLNHFFPTFKLHEKRIIKSRTRRVYRDPLTPYQRVMRSGHVADSVKQRLQEVHNALNPIALSNEEKKVRTQIDRALKALRTGQVPAGLLTVPPAPEPLAEPVLLNARPLSKSTTPPHQPNNRKNRNTITNFRVSPRNTSPSYKTGT